MNVKVEVELVQLPSKHEEQQMYEAAESLTDDPGSIVIISSPDKRASSVPRRRRQKAPLYTPKQGQYLAFIYYYAKIHRMAPSEADFQAYFRVTPPTVHRMISQLEQHGLISRIPHQARSIQLLLSRDKLPDLE